MRNLVERRWMRGVAAVLFVVFLLLSAASSVIVRYARSDGWYQTGSSTGFELTNSCRSFVNDANYYVEQNVRWLEDMSLDSLGSYAGPAYAYRIVDTKGNVLADTTTETSVFVSDNGVVPVPEPGFTVMGYVNIPVEPYSGCYSEYLMYDMFFSLRYLLLALKIAGLVLAGLMLLILCLGAAKRGREDRLTRFLKKPFDLVLMIGLTAYAAVNILSTNMMYAVMRAFVAYTGTWPYEVHWALIVGIRYFLNLLISAVLLWYLSGQLGAGILTKNLLSRRLLRRLPQPVFIMAFFLAHAILLFIAYDGYYDELPKLLLLFIDVAAAVSLIVYVSQATKIRRAADELARGNLTYKSETKTLYFVWKTLGVSLNRIGDGMASAVEDRMRSERMKTELITNVSHDLKTPLTSVINYIELLKSDDLTPETRAEYLAILEKQSARLKKLTEDVVEASKAASGTVTVKDETIDTVELLQQFLGEYEGRFKSAEIEPLLSVPEEAVEIRADSGLLGRVIDNLLSNVIKYALPGTRAYIDLEKTDEKAILTVKNISREPLNISADELLERFVRGDSSRHSEGSGLGLSIARSLTGLMGGALSLYLDGDLFKAEIVFPIESNMDLDKTSKSEAI